MHTQERKRGLYSSGPTRNYVNVTVIINSMIFQPSLISFLGIKLDFHGRQSVIAVELLDRKSLIRVFSVHLRSSSPVPWSCRRVALSNMGERKRRISSSGSVNGGLVGGTLQSFTTQKRKMVESWGAFPHPRPQFALFVCLCARTWRVLCFWYTPLPSSMPALCVFVHLCQSHPLEEGLWFSDLWPGTMTRHSFVRVVVNLQLSKLIVNSY